MIQAKLKKSDKPVIILCAAFPYGNGESFFENEIPFLTSRFSNIYLLPMFEEGIPKNINDGITIIPATPPSTAKSIEFIRGITSSGGMFLSEWRSAPGFPTSLYVLYQIARTMGIARRMEARIMSTVKKQKLENGLIYSYWMNQASIGGILAAKQLKWPIISRTHGGDLYKERHPNNYLPWHKWKVKNMDHVLPVSDYGRDYLQNLYPDHSNRIQTARLGVKDRGRITHQPGATNKFHIASCSSIIPLKRVDKILETVRNISTLLPRHSIRWTHIGSGPLKDNLRRNVASAATPNLEIHLPDHMPNEAIIPYYIENNVDLFLNYSTSEGLPVTIMEAFSCGIPAVAPCVGGIPELVDQTTGLLFDADHTPQDVAGRIATCVQSGELEEKSRHARKRWEKEYNQEINYQKFMDFLINLQELYLSETR